MPIVIWMGWTHYPNNKGLITSLSGLISYLSLSHIYFLLSVINPRENPELIKGYLYYYPSAINSLNGGMQNYSSILLGVGVLGVLIINKNKTLAQYTNKNIQKTRLWSIVKFREIWIIMIV